MNRPRPIHVCLGLAALAWGNPAGAAASGDLSQLLPLSLEELLNTPVVTASRQRETRGETPAHIVVITREQIRERRYRNLADLMEDLPGVDFMRGTKSSAYNNFAMQGYTGSNRILVMLDGVRVGHPAGGNFPVAENFSLHPARQVEILYGPAAALYGADAVAGVINIITDHAGRTPGGWVSLGAGNDGSRETAFTAAIRNQEKLALSMGGHWQRADRAPLDRFYPRDFPKVDARTFGGAVVVPAAAREDYVGDIGSHSLYARLDAGDDLTFGYYRNRFRSLTSTGDTPATALYREDARWDTLTDTLHGKYSFDLTPALSGELVVDYSVQEIDPKSRYVNIYTAFNEGYEYVRGERLAIEQNLNWRIDHRHRVQTGLGYQDYYAIEAHSLPSPYNTALDPGAQGMVYRNTTLPIDIHDSSFHNVSVYAQLQSQWSEDISTMAGLRHDQHSAHGGSLNTRLGAVWSPREQHYFKLLYGEAFRAPSPEESLSSFGSFDGSMDAAGNYIGTGFRVPNFNLAPEKVRTVSLTWDWRPRPELNVVANGYHSHIKNLIVTRPSTATNSIPGAVLISPESKGNAGEEKHTGLDLMAQYRFQLGHAWSVDAWGSASWVRGSIDEGNGVEWDLAFVADNKLKLGATFRYLDRVTITPQLLLIGDTGNGRKSATPPDRLTTPGYTLTNLHVGWHRLLDGNASLWLDVYNLFDERYYAAHGSGSRTFFSMPQQPRSWMATLEYRF
jgi:outer membrane receptor for ferrienterochelin and colicins